PLPVDMAAQPYELLSVLQTADRFWGNLWTVYGSDAEGRRTGVSLAALDDTGTANDAIVVQWDGADTVTSGFCPFGGCPGTANGNHYQFELYAKTDIDFEPGTPEIIFGYGRIEGAKPSAGVVGLRGWYGPSTPFGPIDGPLSAPYAYDDLDSKLKAQSLVCYDYRGPEQSRFKLRFKARVDETAAGQTLNISVQNGVQGIESTLVQQLVAVPRSIQLAAIADQTVEQGGTLSGIAVLYSDVQNTANTISVSGAHVSATVHGSEPGANFDLTPEAGFSGETTVTVTVADASYPSDAASTSFKLTVTPKAGGGTTGGSTTGGSTTGGNSGGGGGGALSLLQLLGLFGLALLCRRWY
ncbi:MAG: Ig-like domain-containing protein, partial [Solimonas sp.]